MKYKGILLDIDNTLYAYDESHKVALGVVIEVIQNKFSLSELEIDDAYHKARKMVQIELGLTAASHNRILYFQKMLEILNINSLEYSLTIYNLYWDNFLKSMKPFTNVYTFLEKYKNKICLVTDLTAHIQLRKIKELKLDKYISLMVSSEEAGREKPHPYMFMAALKKMNLQADEVCMIGDSFNKDIVGATNLGIDSIWINLKEENKAFDTSLVTEVYSFEEIKI
jgi:putative hydrolase of the HAD superfamily